MHLGGLPNLRPLGLRKRKFSEANGNLTGLHPRKHGFDQLLVDGVFLELHELGGGVLR